MNKKIKVVVADDTEIIVRNMKSIIESNPRVEEVITAFDGEDEINKIINLKPDLVFTDNQMPKKTGIEIIEEIKENSNIMKQPQFVLVTGDRDSDLIIKSRELEFCIEFKPIKPERINEYIDKLELIESNIEIKRNNKQQKEGFFKRLFKTKF